jgi:DNA polymerase III sliding clamp (beta) subunit (PCNA family)
VSAGLEITVRRHLAAQLADWVLPAVPVKASLLVNSSFQVTVSPGRLCIAGTSSQVSVFAETAAVVTDGEGTVYIPARKLKALLDKAEDGDVTVTVKDRAAVVRAANASWTLGLPAPDSYAGLPDLSGAEWRPYGRKELHAALSAVRHAVGADAGRPQFTQVRIYGHGGKMYASAADSGQSARALLPGFPFPLQVPGPVLGDLLKLLAKSEADEVEVADLPGAAVFRAAPVTIAAAKTPAEPASVEDGYLAGAASNGQKLTVGRDDLLKALGRVKVSSNALTSAVALVLDAGGTPLTLVARDDDRNSAEEPVPAKWDGQRELLVVSAGHLTAMLGAYPGEECTFAVGKARGRLLPPLLLEDEDGTVTFTCPPMIPRSMGY